MPTVVHIPNDQLQSLEALPSPHEIFQAAFAQAELSGKVILCRNPRESKLLSRPGRAAHLAFLEDDEIAWNQLWPMQQKGQRVFYLIPRARYNELAD